ncbi:MAG: hypothetical protein GY696_36170, partial [Gammaproteobacteria bacterium]|nr:hypothetical protein [Gammaproteobacteria bacterium]
MELWRGPKDYREKKKEPKRRLPPAESDLRYELFITLLRLRLDPHLALIHILFGFSTSKITESFHTWLKLLNEFLGKFIRWPSRSDAEKILAPAVNAVYPGLTGIVDCTEPYIKKPQALEAQVETWSSYKHSNTVKYLIVIRGDGGVSFVSKGYPGGATDNQIFKEALGPILQPGDVLLAD